MSEQLYKLSCPSCGNTELLVQRDDMEDNEFIGDPIVVCQACAMAFRISEAKPSMCSEGQVLHMERG